MPNLAGPDTEAQRLAALHEHEILDSAAEPEFDAIVRIAKALFGLPMVAIALLDTDRLWLKAQSGLDRDSLPRGLGLVEADGAALPDCRQVEDLRQHPQLAELPMVDGEPGLRFCASAPIVDEAGWLLGSVLLLDTAPRRLDPAQQALLHDLARLATAALRARQRARQLQALALTDPLTGVAGRQQFEQVLDVELRHSMRSGEHFAVLRLDLDGFGDINTAFGQEAGDLVLREVGRRLQQQVRLGDLLARLGNDDFGIVMRHGGIDEAEMLAARTIAAVRQPIALGPAGESVCPGISIGLAAYTDTLGSVSEMLAQAETSLQRARAEKESRWTVFGKLFDSTPLRPDDPIP